MNRTNAPALALALVFALLAACGGASDPTSPPAAASGAPAPIEGSPRQAFDAYCAAVETGQLARIQETVTSENAARFERFGPQVAELLRDAHPDELLEIAPAAIDGDSATIEVVAIDDGHRTRGTITCRIDGGAWKVDRLDWKYGTIE